jgi:hypothetical protein
MLPEFLTKRLASFGPQRKAAAAEFGVSDDALGVLNGALAVRDGDVVKRSTYVFRSPYAVQRTLVETSWQELAAAGLADTMEGGWRLRPRGLEIAEELGRRLRTYVRGLPLPTEPTRRAASEVWRLAERVPQDAPRTELVRRLTPPPGEPASDAITLSRGAQILWGYRDDCHIPAWQAAGYEGPVFDVLSYVWSSPPDVTFTKIGGNRTFEDLAKALSARQPRADLERNVDALIRRGDVARDGDAVRLTTQGQHARDAIEDETDRRYFAIWDLEDAATARLGHDLRTVIDSLPK